RHDLGTPFGLAFQGTTLQNKVPPLHVAAVAHLVEEGSGERMSGIGPRHHGDRRSRQNQPHSVGLASLLRLNRQYKTEAESENDREPDQPHGPLGGDGWRESSRTARAAPEQSQSISGRVGPLLVSVSGSPPTQRCAGPAPSGSNARSSAIFSEDLLPHHGRRGRIRGRRAVRRGTRAFPSASGLRQRVIEFGEGLLRLDGGRRKNKTDSENDREPDQPHGHPACAKEPAVGRARATR